MYGQWVCQIFNNGHWKMTWKIKFIQQIDSNNLVINCVIQKFVFNLSIKIKVDYFTASDSWVYKWKRRHRIVSRKATRIVSAKSIKDAVKVKQLRKLFHTMMKIEYTTPISSILLYVLVAHNLKA